MKQSILILSAVTLLASCAHRTPMVKTTTVTSAPHAFGASTGGTITTTTEAPYESPFKGKLGDAAANMFTR